MEEESGNSNEFRFEPHPGHNNSPDTVTFQQNQVRARVFDDELSLSLFKLALIQAYCFEAISTHEVARIFAQIEELGAA